MICKIRKFPALCAILIASIANAQGDQRLLLEVDTPIVNIEERGATQNFVRLPALEYAFRISAVCTGESKPASLLLSVADTRRSLQADEIDADGATAISLNIPAGQLAPVVVRNFCVQTEIESDDNAANNVPQEEQLTLPATLSVQASLRCASETTEQTVYMSKPLDITLICEQIPASLSQR